jgi:cobyrinic acid a,c-diamide synthase
MSLPRILIAGLRGGNGKTFLTMGLAAALRRRGLRVAPFKKGPDYIDAAWLSVAAGCPCRNLDLFLMSEETILRSFFAKQDPPDIALVEGNRGLYDGVDAAGTSSTAELAIRLKTPVLLVVDSTKATRTVAAMVLGCQQLNPEVPIRGVILNRTGNLRHEAVVRQSVERTCALPVLGAVPRLSIGRLFPERHLGLVPPQEHGEVPTLIGEAADTVEQFLDLETILDIARQAPAPVETGPTAGAQCRPDHLPGHSIRETGYPIPNHAAPLQGLRGLARDAEAAPDQDVPPQTPVRIGVFRDAAFQFYYPENLEALQEAGGQIIEMAPTRDERLPDVDALYIGGGFPETLAPQLSDNVAFRTALSRRIDEGLPVYAECGGTVYLGQQLVVQENVYPMVGVLPVVFAWGKKPQGHGYTEVETVAENPFFSVGDSFRGHEFHYTYVQEYLAAAHRFSEPGPGNAGIGNAEIHARSRPRGSARLASAQAAHASHVSPCPPEELTFALRIHRGFGFDGQRDGLCWRNVLANYTHVHARALGTEHWAASVVRQAVRFKSRK